MIDEFSAPPIQAAQHAVDEAVQRVDGLAADIRDMLFVVHQWSEVTLTPMSVPHQNWFAELGGIVDQLYELDESGDVDGFGRVVGEVEDKYLMLIEMATQGSDPTSILGRARTKFPTTLRRFHVAHAEAVRAIGELREAETEAEE